MIPREFTALVWGDIEELVSLGREEDDTIEFKGSFKGGPDFSKLGDRARESAIDAIAQEVIAFLNTRGGDVVIGVAQAPDGRPVAASITAIKDPEATADRLARSLAALIEPAQTNISVRPITDPSNATNGVIAIRVRPSIRAPHRSKRTRECYARRGSESVPMAMDEIQDLTMYRARIRLEQQELLGSQFTGLKSGGSEFHLFEAPYFHIRTVFFPLIEQEIEIDETVLAALTGNKSVFYTTQGSRIENDVAFGSLAQRWKPILRGKRTGFYEDQGVPARMQLASKRVRAAGTLVFDFAIRHRQQVSEIPIVYSLWLTGYFAQICNDIADFLSAQPNIAPAAIRVGIRSVGDVSLVHGDRMWEETYLLPDQQVFLPDFSLVEVNDLAGIFQQLQVDIMSLAGQNLEAGYVLHASGAEGSQL